MRAGARVRARRGMRVSGAVCLTGAVLLSVLGGTASASTGAASGERPAPASGDGRPKPPPDARGPVVTHPVETPHDYPAGEVCAFPSHTEFPVSEMTQRTWYDEAGDPVFAYVDGPLVARITNAWTGETIERDISGAGWMTYPDADSHILHGGDWSASFHTADRPVHNRWIISRGFMAVQITERDGTVSRTLRELTGPYEDVCRTLG